MGQAGQASNFKPQRFDSIRSKPLAKRFAAFTLKAMTVAYDEVMEFLARGVTPEELVAFKPSAEASARFESLIRNEKAEGLLPEEHEELERMMEVERVMSLAKAKARAALNKQ